MGKFRPNKSMCYTALCAAFILAATMTACGQTGAGTADETKAQTETTTAETSKKSYWDKEPAESKAETKAETTTSTTAVTTTKSSETKSGDNSSRKSFWDKDDDSKEEKTTTKNESSDNISQTEKQPDIVNMDLRSADIDFTLPYTPDEQIGTGKEFIVFPQNSLITDFYEAPSEDSAVIETLMAGSHITVYARARSMNDLTFNYIKVGDRYGWCKGMDTIMPEAFTQKTFDDLDNAELPDNIYETGESVYCLADKLEVKAYPSDDAPTIEEFTLKSPITLLGDDNGGWRFTVKSYDANYPYPRESDDHANTGGAAAETFGWIKLEGDNGYNNFYEWDEFESKYTEIYGETPSRPAPILATGKPAIYLYPEKETKVEVKLELHNAEFWTTYPKYDNGWTVTAMPNGKLKDKEGHTYDYLFWDSSDTNVYDMSKGFCVKGEDTVDFLREKLSLMGLNETEMNEFITYWLPQMEHNKYNIIAFQTDQYDRNFPISVTPEPDSMLRLFMTYKPTDKYTEIEPQKLKDFERKGFTVVEWGGEQLVDNFYGVTL